MRGCVWVESSVCVGAGYIDWSHFANNVLSDPLLYID